MMTPTMRLEIVSAEKEIYSGEVESISLSGIMGELGIFPGHAPLLTALKPGNIKVIFADKSEDFFYVSSGMLEVQPFAVTVLADTALRANDIDEVAAQQAKELAERTLANQNSQMDFAKATAELAEAIAQIRAVQKMRERMK